MMDIFFILLLSFAILLTVLYFILISSYCYGWLKIKRTVIKNETAVFVSVIIAARNEEENIVKCLDSILEQSYPENNFEIIVVDDSSTDKTNWLIREYAAKISQVRLVTLSEHSKEIGKKNAIRTGVGLAKGELIVSTDADCVVGVNWLSSIVSLYTETNAKMIIGPVSFQDELGVFEKMQSVEFMALVASGGASLYFEKAIMCNGANLAYTKQVFIDVNGFEGIDEKASGDDVLLMYKIKKRYPEGIKFLKNEQAIVFTKAKPHLKEFMHQRRRWASKGFNALNYETKRVSIVVYLFNLILVVLPLLAAVFMRNTALHPSFVKIYLILFGIKCFIDFLLLFLVASFFKKRKFLIYFLPEQLMYMFYIGFVGSFGAFGKYEWKGRKIN